MIVPNNQKKKKKKIKTQNVKYIYKYPVAVRVYEISCLA
jgi:hypothetical protein